MGRILLFAAAMLLVTTAVIHAMGQPMVDGWVQALGDQQRAAICLVWMTDSIDWAVVAVLWVLAAWKKERAYLIAAAVAAAIPSAMAAGILRIEPMFFGGWMLIGSVALAGAGITLSWHRRQAA
jgi:hypothetical protein